MFETPTLEPFLVAQAGSGVKPCVQYDERLEATLDQGEDDS